MDNQSPTEKAVAMAQRMEQLELDNQAIWEAANKEREKHRQEMEVQKAYVAGIEITLNALLGRTINL